MRNIRNLYTRDHKYWPESKDEALDEITEVNDLLDKGGLSTDQRNWAYMRRKKLIRYITDEGYRSYTKGVNKAMETKILSMGKKEEE